MEGARTYIAIDLKSFYASVECVARGLDPLTTNLVVADASRTEKTICLAVSPSLKSYGIPGRARLFEVVQKVREINAQRRYRARRELAGGVYQNPEIQANPAYALDYIVATPRMSEYMRVSSEVYATYLRYVAQEDIHPYSIDEVFIDVTAYLGTYRCTARELAMRMIKDVLAHTGITATAGIGPNLYLAKVAMDIEAKHSPADAQGVRIAELDEMSYRRRYWSHTPITDFWRVGHGLAARLASAGMYTMGDVARMSLRNEEVLYRLFGVNAELLIDHAWGWEPCTMAHIKAYRPSSHSLSIGQVLSCPYSKKNARVVVKEMADTISLDLVEKKLLCSQLIINVSYDAETPEGKGHYGGETARDYYGRTVPKPVHGSVNFSAPTSSTREIVEAALSIFDRSVDSRLMVRRLNVTAAGTMPEEEGGGVQLDLFRDDAEDTARERRRQEAILAIKKKFGKNAILKGMNFEEGATQIERNAQVGGHKA